MSCHVITEAQTCESWRVWQEEFSNPLNRFPQPSHLVALKYSQLPCSASPSPKYPMTWRWLRAPERRKSSESQSLPPSHPPAHLQSRKAPDEWGTWKLSPANSSLDVNERLQHSSQSGSREFNFSAFSLRVSHDTWQVDSLLLLAG